MSKEHIIDLVIGVVGSLIAAFIIWLAVRFQRAIRKRFKKLQLESEEIINTYEKEWNLCTGIQSKRDYRHKIIEAIERNRHFNILLTLETVRSFIYIVLILVTASLLIASIKFETLMNHALNTKSNNYAVSAIMFLALLIGIDIVMTLNKIDSITELKSELEALLDRCTSDIAAQHVKEKS